MKRILLFLYFATLARADISLPPAPITKTIPTAGDVSALTVPDFTGASVSFGTGVVGNARGIGAVDFTQFRLNVANVASGDGAFSGGINNRASGDYAITLGNGNTASGLNAITLGAGNTATGEQSIALGNGSEARADQSFAVGQWSFATGRYAVAMGDESFGIGSSSFAVGADSVATGVAGFAAGYGFATGDFSVALGRAATTGPVFKGDVAASIFTISEDFVWGGAVPEPNSFLHVGDTVTLFDTTTKVPQTKTVSAVTSTTVTLNAAPGNGEYYLTTGAGAHGQQAYSVGSFAIGGDSQESEWLLRASTTGAVATRLTLDGTAASAVNQIRIFTGQARAFTVDCVGMKDDGTLLRIIFKGVVRNSAGTMSISGLTQEKWSNSGAAAWTIGVTADNTDKLLAITATGEAATNIRWVAKVVSTELAWFRPDATLSNNTAPELSTPKVYRALLSQSGTDAPTVTVLENTLGGTVVWTRTGAGVYRGTLASAFPSAKTMFVCQSIHDPAADDMYMTIARGDDNYFGVTTGAAGANSDDVLGALGPNAVQVFVYP